MTTNIPADFTPVQLVKLFLNSKNFETKKLALEKLNNLMPSDEILKLILNN